VEDDELGNEVIYSELSDPLPSLSRSTSCLEGNRSEMEGRASAAEEEGTYVVMRAALRPERKRICSESSTLRSALLSPLALAAPLSASPLSVESVYVTMSNDRKHSLTSEIYALATGVEPRTSGP
jgi:hypothetical protein